VYVGENLSSHELKRRKRKGHFPSTAVNITRSTVSF
jgi:hypothetical protein